MANKKLESLESAFFSSYSNKGKKKKKDFAFNANFAVFFLAAAIVFLTLIVLSRRQPASAGKTAESNTARPAVAISSTPRLPSAAAFFLEKEEIKTLPFRFTTEKKKGKTLRLEFSSPFNIKDNLIEIVMDKADKNTGIKIVFRDNLYYSNSSSPSLAHLTKTSTGYLLNIAPGEDNTAVNLYKINQIRIIFPPPETETGIWSIKKITISPKPKKE